MTYPTSRVFRLFYIERKNPKADPRLLFENPHKIYQKSPKFSLYSNKLIKAPPTLNMIDNVDSSTDFSMTLLQFGSNFTPKLLSKSWLKTPTFGVKYMYNYK